MTDRLDPLLKSWREHHRPLCPECKGRDEPSVGMCARVWAPLWFLKQHRPEVPVNETSDEVMERLRAAEHEVELLRRENARLRGDAAGDAEAASNWRRYVACVGEKRAFLFVAAKETEDA